MYVARRTVALVATDCLQLFSGFPRRNLVQELERLRVDFDPQTAVGKRSCVGLFSGRWRVAWLASMNWWSCIEKAGAEPLMLLG